MHRALLALVIAGGCVVQTTAVVRGDRDGVAGGGISVEGVISRLRFGIDEGYERVDDATGAERGVIGFDYTARFGVVTTILDRLTPAWIDLGPGIGFGLASPTDDADLIGHAWAGAWLDARLWPSKTHPVLRVEVQRDAYSGELRGGAQFVVGLGFVTESKSRW